MPDWPSRPGLKLYPDNCISDAQLCNFCYGGQSCTNCTNNNTARQCSAYCNSGCNTKCDSVQSFCALGIQTVTDHESMISKAPAGCWVKNEIISFNWTASFWNGLRDQCIYAANLGVEQNQGSLASTMNAVRSPNTAEGTHPPGSLITASDYNEQVRLINHFNRSLSQVAANEVILGTHAQALVNGYESMRFNNDVCDVCNASAQNRFNCNCGAPCSCGCSCGCTCGGCSCDCGCDCSCGGCPCDCSSPD